MSQDTLDTRQDTQYDLVINKDRTLKATFSCYYMSGNTEVEFNFSTYTGATLDVKPGYKSSVTILSFSTTDGSILLSATGNTFQLNKEYSELANLRAGEYLYDMYISKSLLPKRAFSSGKFIIKDRVTT